MNSLKIEFGDNGAELIVDEIVSDRLATIQAAMINFGTAKGSDPALPARGTNLLATAVSGLINEQEAIHASNFAAVDTRFFVRENEDDVGQDRLKEIITSPVILNPQFMQVPLQFTFESGAVVGTLEPLLTHA